MLGVGPGALASDAHMFCIDPERQREMMDESLGVIMQLLDGSEPVSMNMWGFTPTLFNYLQEDFVNFLNDEGKELKSEFLIPTVINNLVQNNQEEVYVLRSNASWFGITYKEDKPFVINKIQGLIHSGIYSSPLL